MQFKEAFLRAQVNWTVYYPEDRLFNRDPLVRLHGKSGIAKGEGPYTVHFITSDGEKIDVKATEGDTMLDLAQRYDIDLECACEGSLACSTCHVICDADYYDKMEEPSDEENDMLDLAFGLTETSRLGCQIEMNQELDGLTVRIPSATRNLRVDVMDNNEDTMPENSTASPSRKVIVVLENASLEAARLNTYRPDSKMQLLNCDEHQSILKRLGRDIADARPDIVHQRECLLTLLDSPLNRSGHLEVYIHTAKGVVIRINPECRIPRTIKRFSGLMGKGQCDLLVHPLDRFQLLERGSITGDSKGHKKLLEIVPAPVTQYFPSNARKFAMSWNAPRVRLYRHFKNLPEGQPIVVAVGAMAKGPDTFADSYVDEKIGISQYALSAAVACGKVCCALEDLWDVM
ncbi:hypothetical protein EC973_000625 [Apophysomyces ossiformis]|uniref:2Fe-2S ferredoxin-type domain-containing protein n=1 Tax=Apophysomyces ossiformis TaxID=679940 RepID=A0A8H7ESW2_9FUNG|nr:hypothetical protein EC973_000625 [Apophysomyces ossiformis]